MRAEPRGKRAQRAIQSDRFGLNPSFMISLLKAPSLMAAFGVRLDSFNRNGDSPLHRRRPSLQRVAGPVPSAPSADAGC